MKHSPHTKNKLLVVGHRWQYYRTLVPDAVMPKHILVRLELEKIHLDTAVATVLRYIGAQVLDLLLHTL